MNHLLNEERRITDQIEQHAREVEGLKRELAAIQRMIAAFGGRPAEARRKRPSVKGAVLDLLAKHEQAGLTATEVVEADPTLDKASVSSLLSRLKKDGVLALDGSKYRIIPSPRSQAPLVAGQPVGSTH